MKKRTPISKIMTSDILTANHTHSLKEVDALLKENNIHHLPVVSGEELIGMISKSDLDRISFISEYGDESVKTQVFDGLSIEQVMTKSVQSLQPEDTIKEAAEILSTNEFHALPVVSENKVVGIVTSRDLMKFMIEEF